jgi:hypothetical protein
LEALQKIPTIVLDPYLLMSLSAILSTGALSACLYARFAICDHMPSGDFLPEEYERLMQAINQENIETLSVPAVEMADLLPMRNALVLNQIATIAAARFHGCMFASDCRTFRRAATTVLEPAHILCGRQVHQRFNLS